MPFRNESIIFSVGMELQIINSILKISQDKWQDLAPPEVPFLNYHFLSLLESEGCLGRRTGWLPHIFCVFDQNRLVGAMPAYLRFNSFGEYIFDFQWADAFHQLGLKYYPKLTSAIPFTPITASKLLVSSKLSTEVQSQVRTLILTAFKSQALKNQVSSAHALFIEEDEIQTFEEAGFFVRESYQYHWKNDAYTDFRHFLSRLRSKRRNEIMRERSKVDHAHLTISRLTGDDLTQRHAEMMHGFYLSTIDKKSGFEFLTESFFHKVFAVLKNQILFVLAEKDNVPVAGALNYFGIHAMYGRHWGCHADYKALHFELCYYQGIEFAIERKIPLFEGGAQGEHKFNRGFLPCRTYSAHFIQEPALSLAIRRSCSFEKVQIAQLIDEAHRQGPFARGETKN